MQPLTLHLAPSPPSARERETIHSGHFMVSHFEAEAQDDEDDPSVSGPGDIGTEMVLSGDVTTLPHSMALSLSSCNPNTGVAGAGGVIQPGPVVPRIRDQHHLIETSLNKLFQCMSLAYRQKLTSPKWNRFKGVKLKWKDKIRLNNVIWRCWHMQFIMKQNALVCQFASPLDVDTHIKPEATILEGKYWKRRAEAVKAEYKKWRMYYRNRSLGCNAKDTTDVVSDMDILDWQSQGDSSHMLVDEDYLAFMSDTLFTTITSNQPFAFPDTREIARSAGLADFIQPSLGPLQPNLDDFMDTFEPLQELLNVAKLTPVPEETIATDDNVYKNSLPHSLMNTNFQHNINQNNQYPLSLQTHQLHQTAPQIQQGGHPVGGPILSQNPLNTTIQSISNNSLSINNQQSNQGQAILPRVPSQNQGYSPQQTNSGAIQSVNLNSNMMHPQGQTQSIIMQPYIHNTNMLPHQTHQNAQTAEAIMNTQNVIAASQDQMHKMTQSYGQTQKIYPHPNSGGYQDPKYNVPQGFHQSHVENISPYNIPQRGRSGSGGYSNERTLRNKTVTFVPPPSHPYNQFQASPTQVSPQCLSDKPSYPEQCLDSNLNAASHNSLQQISLTAGIYLGTIAVPNDGNIPTSPSNPSIHGSARFKMPSPPLQVTNSPIAPVQRQNSLNSITQQQQQTKGESFRSNSLPLGATLNTIMGTSRSRRRPRSGSSSPAPPRRAAPLLAAASEPVLSSSSVLLAHLLNTKVQGQYKSSSIHSLKRENAESPEQHDTNTIITPVTTSMVIVPSSSSTSPQINNIGRLSPISVASPQSPPSPLDSSGSGREHRRSGHMYTEQKRRHNIKNGFDLLQSLIPQLSQNPNSKVSKAAMLQKGAEYIRQLQTERNQMKEEMDSLRQQIECLNNAISNCQSLLPATGAPVSRQRSGKLKEMFDEYVAQRTKENWKFWIFSLLVEPMLVSFNNNVSPASKDELKRSTLLWAEQHCSLVEMRPAVLISLRTLCTTTEILSDPERLPEEARAAVNKKMSKDQNYTSSNCK